LTAVLGNLRLAERTLAGREPDGRPLAQLRAAIKAGERGARLTAQLLAFARRQQLVPAPVDLNAVLEGMADLLPAALGIGIAIDLRPCPGLWPALADVNQVETALLNLAINARDAMPEGGTLTIATGAAVAPSPELPDLPPGDYAVLSVADTGTGMPPEVRARAFEPFFTTKAQGKGSGLGLSMVYGIVRQLGGTARIDSAPGRGTAVRLYLPRAVAEAAPEAPAAEPPPLRPGAAEVLVVDDDAAVREVTAAWLAEFGYRPVQADSAAAALALLGDGARPELVLVDYAMPGMDGLQLARALRLSRPGLPVVFVTGYADTAAEEELARHHILRKPYRPAELAAAIGEALGELREAG
ncbi:MAG TPA: ATP-binding protein, partial [Alphaproteobacteria bacterium]|nr:ATP-binding protein [Alphaproteobacteria bacterium]